MNADGSDVKRISFGTGRYGTPVWSPRGDLIAFTKIDGGKFYIGVMRPDGSGERLLTESFLVEGADLGAQRPRSHVFSSTPSDAAGKGGSTPALHDRPDGLQRTRGDHTAGCVRSGVVPLDSMSNCKYSRAVFANRG